MLSKYARKECLAILAISLMLIVVFLFLGWWWLAVIIVAVAAALLSFFRDPQRSIPPQRGAMVSPADGKISSIHEVEHFEPLGEKAVCIRIFLSVFDVHVNRSPCHAAVESIQVKSGLRLSALNPRSAEENASVLVVLTHPTRRQRIAAVRLIAGMFARTIVCAAREGQILQRGERIGIIKLGSTAELYLPLSLKPRITVNKGQYVYGGATVLAQVPQAENSNPLSPPGTPGERTGGEGE